MQEFVLREWAAVWRAGTQGCNYWRQGGSRGANECRGVAGVRVRDLRVLASHTGWLFILSPRKQTLQEINKKTKDVRTNYSTSVQMHSVKITCSHRSFKMNFLPFDGNSFVKSMFIVQITILSEGKPITLGVLSSCSIRAFIAVVPWMLFFSDE